MSFVSRSYDEIVRDLLTTMTGGTVGESLPAPVGDSLLVPEKLSRRPVRRVSHLQGFVTLRPGQPPVPYRFTPADFELVSTTDQDAAKDAIRFREGGRRPAPGTRVIVNYYPSSAPELPVTDVNVGSVARTLMETVARELAGTWLQLERIYDAAFLETAEAASLDRVVALVGVRRLPSGHPVVRVRFTRRAGASGQITIPAGTAVTDAAAHRYLTLEPLTLEAYETGREVQAGGATPGVPVVAAGALDRLETLIAGISEVTNPEPAFLPSAPEGDEALRRRAHSALAASPRGTVEALRFGLLSLPGVQDAAVVERPNGIPGEIRIDVAYLGDDPAVRAAVARRIEELRPAGIRVVSREAARRRTTVTIELTLAGAGLPPDALARTQATLEERIAADLRDLPAGARVRQARLAARVLEDPAVADARVLLALEGQSPATEVTLPEGEILEVVRPFVFPKPTVEGGGPGAPTQSDVSATLPVHLVAGVTQAQAVEAITLALRSHFVTRGPEAPLSVDGVAAAIRDDTRYALVRAQALLVVETQDGRFLQLQDGAGAHAPAAQETLILGTLDVPIEEGGI